MKKNVILGGTIMAAIVAVMAFNINVSDNNSELSALSLANVEALAKDDTPADSDFKYRTETQSCVITASGAAEGSVIYKLFGVKANAEGKVDLTEATCIYKLGGDMRIGTDITCASLVQSLINAL